MNFLSFRVSRVCIDSLPLRFEKSGTKIRFAFRGTTGSPSMLFITLFTEPFSVSITDPHDTATARTKRTTHRTGMDRTRLSMSGPPGMRFPFPFIRIPHTPCTKHHHRAPVPYWTGGAARRVPRPSSVRPITRIISLIPYISSTYLFAGLSQK